MGSMHVPIIWYSPEEYDDLRAVCIDGDKLPATYEQWREGMLDSLRNLVHLGHTVHAIQLSPLEFTGWCTSKTLAPNAKARNRFMFDRFAIERGIRKIDSRTVKSINACYAANRRPVVSSRASGR